VEQWVSAVTRDRGQRLGVASLAPWGPSATRRGRRRGVGALVEAVDGDGRQQRKMRVPDPPEKKRNRPIRCATAMASVHARRRRSIVSPEAAD
jgi:hypothetical protein